MCKTVCVHVEVCVVVQGTNANILGSLIDSVDRTLPRIQHFWRDPDLISHYHINVYLGSETHFKYDDHKTDFMTFSKGHFR